MTVTKGALDTASAGWPVHKTQGRPKIVDGLRFLLGSPLLNGLMRRMPRSGVLLVAWAIVGTLVSRLAQFVALGLVARMIGSTLFGTLSLFLSTAAMLQMVSVLGSSATITRNVAALVGTNKGSAARVLAATRYATLGASLLIGATIFLAPTALDLGKLSQDLALRMMLVGYVVALTWIEVEAALLSALEKFRSIAVTQVLGGGALLVTLPILVIMLPGLKGAVAGLLIASLIQWVATTIAARRAQIRLHIPTVWHFKREELLLGWRFALPTLMGSFCWAPTIWFCNVFLSRQPGGLHELGLFGVANQWFTALNFLPLMMTRVCLPAFTRHFSSFALFELRRQYRGYIVVALAAVGIPASLCIVLAHPLISLYGSGFEPAAASFYWMVLAAVLAAPAGISQNLLYAVAKPWAVATSNFSWSVTMIIGLIVLDPSNAFVLALIYASAGMIKAIMMTTFAIRSMHRLLASNHALGADDGLLSGTRPS